MPRTLGTQSSVPVLSSLPASPQVGDECLVAGVEYVCLTAGTWTPRSNAVSPTWETPSLVSGYTYNLSGQAANYLLFIEQSHLLEPGTDYSTSGTQITVLSRIARAILDAGGTIRALRLSSQGLTVPSGFYREMPPASPHSLNLEFDSLSGLTEWDPGNRYSLNIMEHGLSIRTDSAPGGVEWGGAYFSLPTGSTWSMFAKVGFVPNAPTTITDLRTVNWGIGLLQNTTNSSQLITLANGWTGADSANGRNAYVFTTLWTSYTTLSTEYGAVNYGALDEMSSYLRITRNGSTYTFWFSRTGDYWNPLYSGTLPWTPAVGGVFICNGSNRALVGAAGHFYHVRFTDSAAADQSYPGRRI